MAESDKERAERVGDAQVSSAYRELVTEEPPRALDEAILTAARRSVRPWTQRYAVPLGLAAVLVLSVTVTLRMQHERPGIESPATPKETAAMAPAPVAQEALKLKPEQQIKSAAPRARSAPQGEPKPFADMPREQAAAAAPAAPAPAAAAAGSLASRADQGRAAESSISGNSARQAEERTARDAEAATRAHQAGALLAKRPSDQAAPAIAAAAPAPVAAKPAAEQPAKVAEQAARVPADTPEREFERIAQLRAEGRHDEADRAFLEFRRRYPGFRITEEMLRRIERR